MQLAAMRFHPYLRTSVGPGLRGPLLHAGRGGVELVASDIASPPPSEVESVPKVEVMAMRWTTRFVITGLVLALLFPSAIVLHVVAKSWQENPDGRYWLILGLGFYIGAALKAVYEALVREFCQFYFLRIEIKRSTASQLFEAVSAALEAQAELSGETCSWDVEVVQEHDAVTGAYSVQYRFLGTRPRNLRISVTVGGNAVPVQKLPLHVAYDPGTDILCSRSGRMTSRATLVLTVPTSSSSVLEVKKLLSTWMETSYEKYTNPIQGVVKIFALQQSSPDWAPEWKLERVKPCKKVGGTGQTFYLHHPDARSDPRNIILMDAKLWSDRSLRVYMVSGPPGVGKSEFILWLASQLGLPIYRLSLSSRSLSNSLLAQLLSQMSISDSKVLVQVDEFQETLKRWRGAASDGHDGVSAGGFCECIQGSTAMRCGVVILSGTPEIMHPDGWQSLPAVYRRIHCKAHLEWLTARDVQLYFKKFLCSFVPDAADDVWSTAEEKFVRGDGTPWAGEGQQISIDMVQQYFMAQITEASVRGIGTFLSENSASFRVPRERQDAFFSLICDHDRARRYLTHGMVSLSPCE